MPKRRAVLKPAPPEADPRQLEIGVPPSSDSPVTRKPFAPSDPAALAKRAVARRRADAAGRVRITVALKAEAAEALSERAIRETRNLEDVAAEILEREAGR